MRKMLNRLKPAETYTLTHTHTCNRLPSLKQIRTICFIIFPFFSNFILSAYSAEVLDLDTALRNTYTACVGIDDELADLKKMAERNIHANNGMRYWIMSWGILM